MKRHYWQYLIDSAGNAVEGARINVFKAGTSTYANIQTSEAALTYSTTEFTEILTDEDGFFDFWISDDTTSPTYGYAVDQKFDISFSKAGYTTGLIEDVQIVWGGAGDGKVKVNDEDTTADYLEEKLLAGNNINISPSGEQLVIAFEGVADTYKVKLNAGDTEDYLASKVVNGDYITVETSGSQLVITGQPGTEYLEFNTSTLTVPATATVEFNAENFCNRCLIHKITITPSGITGTYDFSIYEHSGFSAAQLVYDLLEVNPASPFIDRLPFFYVDYNNESKLHIKITNWDAVSSGDFDVNIIAEKFA